MTRALVYLFASILPVLAIMMGQGPLLQLQSQFQVARVQYEQALQSTKLQLSELGRELKANPALNQDLQEQNFNAVSRTLSGYTTTGMIDQLAILDSQCQYRAHSEQGVLLSSECPLPQLSSIDAPRFQWRALPDHLALDFVMPLGQFGERRYFIMSSTWISNSWLFHFPSLRQSFRSLELSMGSAGTNKFLVMEDQSLPEGPAKADLYSQHLILKFYPRVLQRDMITLQKTLLIALLPFFLAVFHLFRSMKMREEFLKKDLEGLQAWARDLQPEDRQEDPQNGGLSSLFEQIRDRLNSTVKRNYEQMQSCRQHSQSLSQQIVNLEARLMDQQVEQNWMQKTRSLHQQMNGSAKAHLQKLEEVHSLGEDISHLAAARLVRPAQKLQELGQKWADELRLLSPRKLVRTMAERVDTHGESELEKAVCILIGCSQELSTNAINVTLLAQSLLQQLQENKDLAEHWHRMMGAPQKGNKSLLRLVTESQSLIELQEKDIQLHYENQLSEDLQMTHLKIPESTLHSVLYHGQMALIELARERAWQNPTLHHQCKLRESKYILVMSLRGPIDDDIVSTHLPRSGEQHLQLASHLLQGYPIKLTRLPPLQGIQAVALMWEKPAESKAQAAAEQI